MPDGRLYIGNRRYSSWSMRGWLAVRLAGLDVEGGSLKGAGELDVTASFAASGYSYMSGTGSTVIEATAVGTVTQGRIGLEGRTFSNAGRLTVESSGEILGQQGTHLINSGTLVANGELPADEASLTNTGVLEKTEGGGRSAIGFAIDNEATVKVETGTIELTGGGTSGVSSPGSWAATGMGTAIVFDGSRSVPFSLGATVSMSGSIEVDEGIVSTGSITSAALIPRATTIGTR